MFSNPTKSIPNKLYIAGVSWNTSNDGLFNFFARYGTVVSAQIQRDPVTGRSRGFGFVTFAEQSSCDKVLAEPNLSLDGRRMEIKYAVPKGQVGSFDDSSSRYGSSSAPGGRPKKIYIAGISTGVTEEDLKEHFATFGRIVECYIQKDRNTGESRGFAFLTFDSPDSVDKVLQKPSQKIGDKCIVDVKVARPKGETGRPGEWGGFGSVGVGAGPSGWGSGFGAPAPGYASSWGGTGLDGLGAGLGSSRVADGYGGVGGGLGGAGGLGGSGTRDYAGYSQGYDQSYGYGLGTGATGATGTSGYGDTSSLGLSGYPQWSGTPTTLDDAKRVAAYDTGYGAGGSPYGAGASAYGTGASAYGTGASAYGTGALTGATPTTGTTPYDPTGGQYSYGAVPGRRAAGTARRYQPYGR